MIYTAFANALLKVIIGEQKTANLGGTGDCYLGFSTVDPGSDGSNFTEPDPTTYPSYARVQLNVFDATEYTNKWGPVANKSVELAEAITTQEALEDGGWPTFTHFGIFSAEADGVLLAWDLLTDPDGEPDEYGRYPAKTLTVGKNEVAVFRAGSLKLTFN